MLQQHLAETNSYDISTIYNFILNDYMSGGWNTDLHLSSFDLLTYYSDTFAELKNKLRFGDHNLKIKSAVSFSGRFSLKKYYTNYFKYFSSLDLDQILSLITLAKKEFTGLPGSSHKVSTYNDFINRFKIKSQSFIEHYSNIKGNDSLPELNYEYRLFLHPIFNSIMNQDTENSHTYMSDEYNIFISKLQENIYQFMLINENKDIHKMLSTKNFTTNYGHDKIDIFIDSDYTVHLLDKNFDYQRLFNIESKTNA